MNMIRRLALSTTMALSLGTLSFGQHYTQTNLQANTSGAAEATDPQLVNSWGLTRTSGSVWWASDNVTGVATLYNGPGTKQSLVVTIPPADPNNEKTPNGSPRASSPTAAQPTLCCREGQPSSSLSRSTERSPHGTPMLAWRMEQRLPPPTL